jgi:poly(A) polymerase
MLPVSRQSAAALHVLQTLRAAGHQAYLAGGCVRDLLLGREPKDYDVATSATPDVVLALFPRTFAVGAHFGVVLVATCGEADAACAAGEKLAEQDYLVTEVATFRSDGVYSDGRHPDAVKYTLSAEEDVRRRDFTINGLLLDPLPLVEEFPAGAKAHVDLMALTARLKSCPDTELSPMPGGTSFSPVSNTPIAWDGVMRGLKPPPPSLRSAVIDYVGGLADLESGIVRAIGNPGERFEEDHLRMLRGVRFASRFGFQIDPATAAAIRRLAPRTKAVSRERVRDELTKMLTEGHARRAFELLDETALLAEVLPEIARMKGVEQPPQFHPEGDVWAHTLMLLGQLEPGCPLTLAWGALLHDVGKPPTFRRAPDRIRFDGHAEVGVAMAAEICRRFRFSNDETRQILALVENHMRFMDAPRMKASTLKRFFRLDGFDQHLALHRMDCLAGSGHLDNWNFVRDRLAETPAELVRPTPLITGRELIAAGYRPGAAFKQMLQVAEDAQLEGTIATPDEALRLVRERFPAVSD